MINTNDLMKFQSEAAKAGAAFAAKSMEGFQKLAELNMNTAKAGLEASATQAKTLMAAKDGKAFSDMAANLGQPNEQLTAYAKDAFAITSKSNADVLALVEKQVEEGNKQLLGAIDALAKNAPAGSEGAVSFVKQYVTATRSAYEQVSKASKQAMDVAEANFSNATGTAAKATAAKKR